MIGIVLSPWWCTMRVWYHDIQPTPPLPLSPPSFVPPLCKPACVCQSTNYLFYHRIIHPLSPSLPKVNLLAGGMAGACVDIVLYPLDTLKTRLQAQSGTVKLTGFNTLFRGLSSAVVASFPCAAVFWSSYEGGKSLLSNRLQLGENDARLPLIHMAAAAGAEVSNSTNSVAYCFHCVTVTLWLVMLPVVSIHH